MKTTSLPDSNCPACGYSCNAVSDVRQDAIPQPGDTSICLNCGQILTFDPEMLLRKATAAEISDLMTNYPTAWEFIDQARLRIEQRGLIHPIGEKSPCEK
jgi:hypothetical protein